MFSKLKELTKKNAEPAQLEDDEVSALLRRTKFTPEEIRKAYRKLMEENPSGKMTPCIMQNIYKNWFPNGDAAEFANLVFKTYDTDGNGYVDFQEFITALSLTRKGSLRQRLTWIFNIYDANSSGHITKKEMLDALTSINKMGVGFPGVEKFSPQKKVDQIFAVMDKNKDGHLSLNEFIEGARRNPELEVLLNNTGHVNSDIHKF